MKSIFFFLPIMMVVALLYGNCDSFFNGEVTSESLHSPECQFNVDPALRKPTTIDKVIELASALPKPLEIHCFLEALQPPLKIYAVDSVASAQPSSGKGNPRIFIIFDKLILSVVPAGEGRDLLELSQIVSRDLSVKGEIEFPVKTQLLPSAPYTRILDGRFGATSCVFCHNQESAYPAITTGPAYQSLLIAPSFSQRVRQDYMRFQTTNCDNTVDPFRCQMLRSIYKFGQAQDGAWPN